MRKYKIIIISLLLFFSFFGCKQSKKFIKANIHGKTYTFEVADTWEERVKGLMFRRKLVKNSGMFFVFDKMAYLGFYMKNTYIPLDIAFIDSDHRVVDIQSMEPLDEKGIISKNQAQFALEVNRAFFEEVGLGLGEKIEFIPLDK